MKKVEAKTPELTVKIPSKASGAEPREQDLQHTGRKRAPQPAAFNHQRRLDRVHSSRIVPIACRRDRASSPPAIARSS